MPLFNFAPVAARPLVRESVATASGSEIRSVQHPRYFFFAGAFLAVLFFAAGFFAGAAFFAAAGFFAGAAFLAAGLRVAVFAKVVLLSLPDRESTHANIVIQIAG